MAIKDVIGSSRKAADRGTLFLDEIGDLSLELQPKASPRHSEKTVERLGSNPEHL